jgi:low temperature requirement protein LtrA
MRMPRLSAELRERESVRPLELFFDLVFVLVFTQCTALMAEAGDWTGVGRAMLVLAVLWWAWTGYTWLTSDLEPEEGSVRIVIFGAMAGLLIVALCVPEAFGDRAVGFVVAYAVVRLGHILLYLLASRDSPQLRTTVLGFSVSTAIAVGILFVAAFSSGTVQVVLWLVAIVIDYGGPAVFGMSGWRLVPAHFAERHNLVIILALGESIVALGAGADVALTAPVVVAAVLGIGLAAALWWIYFDVVALVTQRRLEATPPGRVRNLLARDSYSYLHLPMVAGIVLGALGLEGTLAHVDEPLDSVHAFGLLGGTAIYLVAHVALRLRNAHTLNLERLGLALVLFALIPAALHVEALVALIGVNVLIWAMIVYETLYVYDVRRYQIRHGLEADVPGLRPIPDPPDDVEHDGG